MPNSITNTSFVEKYNGDLLDVRNYGVETSTSSDQSSNGSEKLYITISDSESGWGENYEQSSAEISAYFNGWITYEKETLGKFGGSGTQVWAKRYKGTGNEKVLTTGMSVEAGTETSSIIETASSDKKHKLLLLYL